MKISMIRHSIRNRGGDRQVQAYLNYLADQGHEVTYWVNDTDTHLEIGTHINIHKIPFSGILGTMWFTLIHKSSADVLLVDLVLMACLGALRNRRKVVYFAQDYDVSYYRFFPTRIVIYICYWIALYLCKVKAISVSDALTKKLSGFATKNISTNTNGIDLDTYVFNQESQYFQQKQKDFVISVFARKDYRKGLDIAVKAIKELMRIRSDRDWEIWALGDEKIEIEGALVRSFGYVNGDLELRDILSAADIFLSPSRQEGCGLLQLQAMACGCAMVTTEAFSLAEDKKNALVSPNGCWRSLAEHLNVMMDDEPLRKSMVDSGKREVLSYNIDDSSVRFEELLVGKK